ncbi:hypothetical protein RA29_20800 [Tateyamaria sp. ANG-S1]|nr:hypothetical protein RA29_20800 [Tateyamaria sp. ANG-S1]
MCVEPHRIVFIDETAVTTKMSRLRGRSLRGARPEADAPFTHCRIQTLLAGLRFDELTTPWVLDGLMDRFATVLELMVQNGSSFAYIETQFAPTLQPGGVVIIADNLLWHKSARAQDCLKAQGNWMLFLPPHNPDLNPSEMACSELNAHQRQFKARTLDALFQSVAQTCDLFPPEQCRHRRVDFYISLF